MQTTNAGYCLDPDMYSDMLIALLVKYLKCLAQDKQWKKCVCGFVVNRLYQTCNISQHDAQKGKNNIVFVNK